MPRFQFDYDKLITSNKGHYLVEHTVGLSKLYHSLSYLLDIYKRSISVLIIYASFCTIYLNCHLSKLYILSKLYGFVGALIRCAVCERQTCLANVSVSIECAAQNSQWTFFAMEEKVDLGTQWSSSKMNAFELVEMVGVPLSDSIVRLLRWMIQH